MKVAGLGAAALSISGMGLATNAGAASMSRVKQEVIETDVLVIGGGFAGIFAAVKAKEKGVDVTMAVKGAVGRSGMSPWGDAFLTFEAYSPENKKWVDFVHKNSEYISNQDYVNLFLDYSTRVYEELVAWGAASDKRRAFKKKVQESGINLIERVVIKDLLMDDSRVAGAIGFPFEEDRAIVIKAKSVVMATGAGGYRPNGFPLSQLTFDGDAMVYKLGITISGKEFNDTHGTSAATPADCWDVRNRVNRMGSMFYGPLDLTASINAHQGNVPYVRAPRPPRGDGGKGDPRGAKGGERPEEPPGGGKGGKGGRGGGGPSVGGASAGHAGHKTEGIWPTDSRCGTSISGLFAAGDALASMQCGAMYTSPGVSGSGSCAQGWVAGERAAEYANKANKPSVSNRQIANLRQDMFAPREREKGYSPAWVTQMLQNTMIPYYVTLVKKEDRLNAALTNIEFLRDHFVPKLKAANTHELRLAHETANMIRNAEMKLRVSLFRTESRGTHFREDYPYRDDKNWLAWILIKDNNGRMELSKEPVPKEWGPDKSMTYEERYPRVRFPGEMEIVAKKNL
jgi:succinate dehydrogenase/fumarate reductase flavoprotein subunit